MESAPNEMNTQKGGGLQNRYFVKADDDDEKKKKQKKTMHNKSRTKNIEDKIAGCITKAPYKP